MRAPSLVTVLSVVLGTMARSVLADAPAAPVYQVIVNPANPAGALSGAFIEGAFLKKVSHWPDERVIRPVDLAADSPTRRTFSVAVIHRSIDAVKGYWQQRIFSGRDVPPPELESDDEVVKYVLRYEGALGYVSLKANLNGAKAVPVR